MNFQFSSYLLKNFFFMSFCFISVNLFSQVNNLKQKDSIYLVHPFSDWVKSKTLAVHKTINNFNLKNEFSLYGNIDFSKQIILNNNYNSPFIYSFDKINNNAFKPGFSVGFRIDAKNQVHNYIYGLSFTKFSTGEVYDKKINLTPFLGEFVNYKANVNFTTANIFLHRKYLLPIMGRDKYRFYFIIGASANFVISKPAINSSFNNNVISFINGDMGVEFDNNSYYNLFFHYKTGSNFINQKLPITINSFQIGMSLKWKDLF